MQPWIQRVTVHDKLISDCIDERLSATERQQAQQHYRGLIERQAAEAAAREKEEAERRQRRRRERQERKERRQRLRVQQKKAKLERLRRQQQREEQKRMKQEDKAETTAKAGLLLQDADGPVQGPADKAEGPAPVSSPAPSSHAPSSACLKRASGADVLQGRQAERGATSAARKKPRTLPPGWVVEHKVRQAGESAGKSDKYYVSPAGRRFRSLAQAVAALEGGVAGAVGERAGKHEGEDSAGAS